MATKKGGLSFGEIRSVVTTALRQKEGIGQGQYLYPVDMYADSVVYEIEGGTGTAGTFMRDYSISQDNGVFTVDLGEPSPVTSKRVYVPVKFDAEFDAPANFDGEYVRVPAKLFELGDYPDKAFSLDEAEADNLTIPSFANVPLMIEHAPSAFDGKLGRVVKAWREGSSIFGEIEIPKSLGTLFKDMKVKLSVGFDLVSKMAKEVSIVRNPRITDAAILKAFSNDENLRKGGSMGYFAKLGGILGLTEKQVKDEAVAEFYEILKEKDAEIERLKNKIEAVEAGQSSVRNFTAQSVADGAVNELLGTGRIVPADAEALKSSFIKAIELDNAQDGKFSEGAAFKALKDAYMKLPANNLTKGTFTVVPGGSTGGKSLLTDSEIFELRKPKGEGK